jgi:hypothetical protein
VEIFEARAPLVGQAKDALHEETSDSAWVSGGETGARDQASIVASEVSTLSHMLAVRPQTALDFSQVSGEYCFSKPCHPIGVGMGAEGAPKK